jgi:hypothetical protein
VASEQLAAENRGLASQVVGAVWWARYSPLEVPFVPSTPLVCGLLVCELCVFGSASVAPRAL